MNDMANYLTTKNRLLVAMLAFILPFSFAKAEVKEDGNIIAKTKRTQIKNETSKSSLFSLPFFSCSFDRLNIN